MLTGRSWTRASPSTAKWSLLRSRCTVTAFLAHFFDFDGRREGPGPEFVELAREMTLDDLGEHVGHVCERINPIELARFDERGEDRPVLGAAVRACEERVLPIERSGVDRTLDNVGVISMRPSSRKRIRPSQRDRA